MINTFRHFSMTIEKATLIEKWPLKNDSVFQVLAYYHYYLFSIEPISAKADNRFLDIRFHLLSDCSYMSL